ncbi:sulfotransferase [uncultured Paraglaciecola sp.]|uniref:tetratricopeptide repeat-containing sulfotransferase family protein n=1 Tax=uncultured Paraglaciecola sp. TaxID=1765024 RepID=UPI0030DA96A9
MNQKNVDHHELIQANLAANNLDKAAKICTDGLSRDPKNAQLWLDLSDISKRLGQNKMVINSALKAIDCEPDNLWNIFHLASCYLQLQAFEPAINVLNKAQSLLHNESEAKLWDKLGELRYMVNQLDLAIEAHTRALAIQPNRVSTRNQLAALLRFNGSLEHAEVLYREVIDLDPANYQACYNLSQLRRFKSTEDISPLLEHCRQQITPSDKGQIMLHYASGKVFEDLGNYDKAFNHYSQGAKLKRKQRPYDISKDIALMKSLVAMSKTLQTSALEIPENLEQSPIFIVGLPRTGTTLVERIIASHSEVISGGELNAFPMALLEAGGKPLAAGLEGLDENLVEKLSPKALSYIGKRYLQLAKNHVGNASIFVDKLPYNFLYCGLILQAIPNAKIVHVLRNPFDAALSNFKMLFDRGYEYSYDLEDTANFIAAYSELMQQWKGLFPDQIHTIEYENLVNNQESETRKLLTFCDLEWDAKCLSFHKNDSASHTASASQVREPIYSRSVNLWRQFESQLTPLTHAFKKHGIQANKAKEL